MTELGEIQKLRSKIDAYDQSIIALLAMRTNYAKQLGILKKDAGLPVHDVKREQEILKRLTDDAILYGLNPDKLKDVYQAIFEMAKYHQIEGR